MRHLLPFVILLAGTLAGCTQQNGERVSVKPGINDPYLNPDLQVEEWTSRFEVESREVFASRAAIVDALNIEPGMDVADIGAGTGLFTRPLAERVGPDGTVYAVDIVPKFIKHIRQRADAAGLDWVQTVLCTEDSVELPDASVDLAFICDVYHHFEYPAESLASLHRALRPGATLVLIDFRRIPGVSSEWLLNHVRAGQEVFSAEIQAAGFELIEEVQVDGLEENYCLRFRRIGDDRIVHRDLSTQHHCVYPAAPVEE